LLTTPKRSATTGRSSCGTRGGCVADLLALTRAAPERLSDGRFARVCPSCQSLQAIEGGAWIRTTSRLRAAKRVWRCAGCRKRRSAHIVARAVGTAA